jgi:steroid 5-alpha reductase family enzyme
VELTLLLAEGEDSRYERAALRWHARFVYEAKNVGIRESQAVLALLAAIPVNALAATALAELLSRRRGFERPCEALVAWARSA